jgi:hypothetical protein
MPYKDPARARERWLKYAKDHAEEARLRTRAWVRANPEKKKEWDLNQLGWTLSSYEEVSAAQGALCAICKLPEKNRKLAADHRHTDPPQRRGLLCSLCNRMVGFAKDNPLLLEAAAAYLRKYGVE